MESVLNKDDFDCFSISSCGIVGIKKDGTRHPISREDYKKLYPEHKNVGCTECIFAQDKNTLLIYSVSRELRERANEKLQFVGKFTMPGWVGHSSFYLFRCHECGNVGVDYPHGYRGEFLYIRCDVCRYEIILSPSRYRDIYERDQVFVPTRNLLKLISSLYNFLRIRILN